MVEETHQEVHASVKESFAADTLNTATTAHEAKADSIRLRTGELTTVFIERDSAGRVIEIRAETTAEINANVLQTANRNSWFYGLNATHSSETADAVDSITEKKEETQEEINTSIPLESLIGSSLVLLAIFYVLYVIIGDHLWPWIKNRRK